MSAPTHTQVLRFEIILLRLKLLGPYKPIDAKSYRVKGVLRLDHGKITTVPENRLRRSGWAFNAGAEAVALACHRD